MNEMKIKEVLSDETFVSSLLEMETAEEVQKALSEKGLEFSIKEIEAMHKALEESNEGNLSEDDLEMVSGGALAFLVTAITCAAGIISAGCAVHNTSRGRW